MHAHTHVSHITHRIQSQLLEVKERNQSLYNILSQGECQFCNVVGLWPSCLFFLQPVVSNTAELLQQVEQLNTVKQELTTEVGYFLVLPSDMSTLVVDPTIIGELLKLLPGTGEVKEQAAKG